MHSFIKLTSMMLNTSKINKITIDNHKYYVYMNNNNTSAFMFFLSGFTISNTDIIEICKYTNYADYTIMTDWMERINNKQ
jgi:hypothetical protein